MRQELESSWAATQEAFVDDPPGAAKAASDLVLRAAKGRGYPVDDQEQLLADLSVHHARQLDRYRRAEATAAALGSAPAPTEQLRQALLWYRAMFQELAESSGPASSTKQGPRSRTSKLRQPLTRVTARRSELGMTDIESEEPPTRPRSVIQAIPLQEVPSEDVPDEDVPTDEAVPSQAVLYRERRNRRHRR